MKFAEKICPDCAHELGGKPHPERDAFYSPGICQVCCEYAHVDEPGQYSLSDVKLVYNYAKIMDSYIEAYHEYLICSDGYSASEIVQKVGTLAMKEHARKKRLKNDAKKQTA